MQPREGGGLLRAIRLTLMDPWQLLGTVGLLGAALLVAVIVGQARQGHHLPKTGPPLIAQLSPSATVEASASPTSDPSPPAAADPQAGGPTQAGPAPATHPPTTTSTVNRTSATSRPTARPTSTPTPIPAPRGPRAILHVTLLSAPMSVSADAGGSYQGDAPIVSYSFNFGDGSALVVTPGPVASHAYSSPGVYSVTVTVTDASGRSASDLAQVTIA